MNEREASSCELTCAKSTLSIIPGEVASYDEPLRVRSPHSVPFAGPRMVSGIHEAINIITERERVGIIIADDRKNDYRKRDVEEQESEEGGGDAEGKKRTTRRRRQRWYPRVRAPLYTRLEEAPRLRGHSKFSGLFRQRRESPSKLMLPGHAISGPVQTARFFSPALVRFSSFFPAAERRRGNIFIILAVTPGSGSWDPPVFVATKHMARKVVKINILRERREKKNVAKFNKV